MGNNLVCYKPSKDRDKTHQISKSNLSSVEQAILKCKMCRDNIKSTIRNSEQASETKLNKAKELIKEKNRERAKVYLKQSKLLQEKIKIAENKLTIIENQILEIEKTQQISEVYKTLEQGNKILKDLREDLKVEKFKQIKEDLQGFKEQNNQITNLFNKHGINEIECDEDVAAELEKFEKELGITSQQQQPKEIEDKEVKLPEAPKNKIKRKEVPMMNEA
jgi:hypothetical protein